MTKKEFIEKIDFKYGAGRYTILGEYKNNKSKILVRCNVCGHEWNPKAGNLLNACKVGCPKCATKKTHDASKMSTEELINRGKQLYGDRYSYEKTNTMQRNDKGEVCFICNECGHEFWQKPSLFLSPNRRKKWNCPNCIKISASKSKKKKKEKHEKYFGNIVHNTESFIKKINEKFPNFYDTSKVVYKNQNTNIILIHDGVEIIGTPQYFLSLKRPKIRKNVHDTESFISAAKLVHGDNYIYDERTKYISAKNKITIKCKIHGYVEVNPNNHLHGCGCPICGREKVRLSTVKTLETFLKEAKEKHKDKYIYDEDTFVNYNTPMRIICPKHGEFWQKPTIHVASTPHGCPICKESKLERYIRNILEEKKIKFISSKHFEWLGRQHLDFYLPEHNVSIECQGKQHFIEKSWNKEDSLDEIIKRDCKKYDLCNKNNVKIFYFIESNISKHEVIDNEKYKNIYTKENTFKNYNLLLENIKTHATVTKTIHKQV